MAIRLVGILALNSVTLTAVAQQPITSATTLNQSSNPPHLAERRSYSKHAPPSAGVELQEHAFPNDLKSLMRPEFTLAAEWQAVTDDIGLSFADSRVTFPTYPWFGPPPPLFTIGFGYTQVDAPPAVGLPADLYQTELGAAWMRSINDRWMMRVMTGVTFATDGNNSSRDAWRFRGGAFAVYRRNSAWTWTFGAIALGRNDLPVVPAVGVIHQLNPETRLELLMPRPRLAFLLADYGARQHWCYVGAALNGATWGAARPDATDDQLTYGDYRVVLGWESTPTPQAGLPFTRGRKLVGEMGYVFSRNFEWETEGSQLRLDDTLMLRVSASF